MRMLWSDSEIYGGDISESRTSGRESVELTTRKCEQPLRRLLDGSADEREIRYGDCEGRKSETTRIASV
jgi:hypothetical protein